MDIELVNQELNFQSQDNNLVIKGGCDLFTTKPIGSDRKLFKTIDKHLDQIMEDNQLSQSLERELQNSNNPLFGSSASPTSTGNSINQAMIGRRGSYIDAAERERRVSGSLINFNKGSLSSSQNMNSNLSKSLSGSVENNSNVDESPFGPLKNITTRKTFAYLIAILNSTYPDHDFSNLQPTTENFHKIPSAEDLIHRFNNIMVSLGKKEDLLNWIWDTVNVYMDFIPSKLPTPNESRHNSFLHTTSASVSKHGSISPDNNSPPVNHNLFENCQIYEFQPSDQSILEDLNYPYQTMWSYYWFIYNKKKKRVSFIYLTALNKIHYSKVNGNRNPSLSRNDNNANIGENISNKDGEEDDEVDVDDDMYMDEYIDDEALIEDDDYEMENDVVGDMEI